MRDEIFKTVDHVEDFVFDASVAAVFDDMLERSIPFYNEVQRMVVEMSVRYLRGGGVFYDIGCSSGNTLEAVAQALGRGTSVRLIGLEPSAAMRDTAFRKLSASLDPGSFEIWPITVESAEQLPDARVITLLYTLQFVRPAKRLQVLKMCCRSLERGGCLIMAEKILSGNSAVRHLFIDLYHAFKARSGYSETEIARKRESLENILIPFTTQENCALFEEAGFSIIEPCFQWYNFAAYIAVKD